MTKEEKNNALHCLKVMIDEEVCEECDLYGTTGTNHCEADCVRVAIKALEQEPCEDAISREKTCDYIAEFINHEYSTQSECEMVEAMIDGIQHLPPVNPQPKTGHWMNVNGIWFKCSECGAHRKMMPAYKEYYCPNCGCRMIDSQESEG